MASIVHDKERKRWKVYWCSTKDGVRRRGSKTFRTRRAAQAYQLEQKEDGCRRVPVAVAVAMWKRHIEQVMSTRTRGHYLSSWDRFYATCPVEYLDEFTKLHIQSFRASLSVKNRTINAYTTAVMSFFRWSEGIFGVERPTKGLSMLAESPPDVRIITLEDFQKTLAVGSELYKERALFLYHTGLRITEFVNLTVNRPDKLSETCGWPCGDRLYVVGKGRKMRAIPLNSIVKSIMEKQKSQHYLFENIHGKQIDRRSVHNQFANAARAAGVSQFGPHALRHLFATRLLVHGVATSVVSQLLGHSSVKVTEKVYAHWMPRDFDGATECLACGESAKDVSRRSKAFVCSSP